MVRNSKRDSCWILVSVAALACAALAAIASPQDASKLNSNQNVSTFTGAVAVAPEDYLKASILSATQHGAERSVSILTAAFVLLEFSKLIHWPLIISVLALSAKVVFLAIRETIITCREQSERKERLTEELKILREEGKRAEVLGEEEKRKINAEILEIESRCNQEKKKIEVEIAQIVNRTESEKKKASAEIERIAEQSKVQSKRLDLEASQHQLRIQQRLTVALIAQITDSERKSEMAVKAFEELILKPQERTNE